MFKNALISVSDKTGLVEFLTPLARAGMRIVSTGGTADHLKKAGLQVTDLKEQTGFPEVMGGRVKTLHPRVHMPLLARDFEPGDFDLLKKEGLEPFDLVVVNLYPFEESLLKKESQKLSEQRKKLAGKVFAHVSRYDSLISHWLGETEGPEFSFGGKLVQPLRYGENPEQSARWYAQSGENQGLQTAKIIQGKELSFNNLLDLEAASLLVQSFDEPGAVAVKHNNPCGSALGATLKEALEKTMKADPVSVFGGIVAVNRKIGQAEALILEKVFLECVVAPEIDDEALEVFSKKKNLRILLWPDLMNCQRRVDLRTIAGGFLMQSPASLGSNTAGWKFLGEVPNPKIMRDLIFAEKVCAVLKSNAIAIVKDATTLGLGMGQVNRVEAVAHAVTRMKSHHGGIENSILASDAFFPFPDSIEKASEAGVKWVLQPGGSMRDQDVFEAAKRWGVNMVLTGERHFRH